MFVHVDQSQLWACVTYQLLLSAWAASCGSSSRTVLAAYFTAGPLVGAFISTRLPHHYAAGSFGGISGLVLLCIFNAGAWCVANRPTSLKQVG